MPSSVSLPEDVERLVVRMEREAALTSLLGLSPDQRGEVPASAITGSVLIWRRRSLSGVPPDTFARLQHLLIIDLGSNDISRLPAGIGMLLDLRVLHADGNQLTELPDEMRQLVKLHTLNVRSNCLETLPEWIGDLRELQMLSANKNKLRWIPRSLARLDNLRRLYLAANPLEAEERSWVRHQLVPQLLRLESTAGIV